MTSTGGSMTRFLSSPIQAMQDKYDVVVIGSGYGGGIAASRLSRAGKAVCVLERGDEKQPGDYPNNAMSLLEEIQIDTPEKKLGSDVALFDIRHNDSINVVIGCGLGGTSLINAGICLRPAPSVFANQKWPTELQRESALATYFDRAEEMLRPSPCPTNFLESAKTRALQAAAAAVRKTAAPVSVAQSGNSPSFSWQRASTVATARKLLLYERRDDRVFLQHQARYQWRRFWRP